MTLPHALDVAVPTLEELVASERLEGTELLLERALLGWGTVSVVGGAAAAVVGKMTKRDNLAAAGRQHLAWGVVDLGIAAWGRSRRQRRSTGRSSVDEVLERGRRLRRVLVVNAGLDVGYVAVGLALVAFPSHVLVRSPRRAATGRAIGSAVAVQGGYLLALDLWAASRLTEDSIN